MSFSPRALPWAEFFSPLQGIQLTFNLYLDENENEDDYSLPDGNSSPKLGAGVRRTEGAV